jgi:type II secretory pathway predicted ATPase ExeA
LLSVLYGFLEEQNRLGNRAVLVIDEAQQLNSRTLENLRLISNLESNGRRLLQLILSAQPDMKQTLSGDRHIALRQRIVSRCYLRTLQAPEAWDYLALRLADAGSDGRMIFDPEAVETLASVCSYTPRLMNVVADNSLIAAYSRGLDRVDSTLVRSVASHFELAQVAVTVTNKSANTRDNWSAESWKKLVEKYSDYELPRPLRDFASSLQLGVHA